MILQFWRLLFFQLNYPLVGFRGWIRTNASRSKVCCATTTLPGTIKFCGAACLALTVFHYRCRPVAQEGDEEKPKCSPVKHKSRWLINQRLCGSVFPNTSCTHFKLKGFYLSISFREWTDFFDKNFLFGLTIGDCGMRNSSIFYITPALCLQAPRILIYICRT